MRLLADTQLQEMLGHMAVYFAGSKDGREQQQPAHEQIPAPVTPAWGFVADLMDTEISSVLAQLALPLWNIATTFAIGTPPEQLVRHMVQNVFYVTRVHVISHFCIETYLMGFRCRPGSFALLWRLFACQYGQFIVRLIACS
jgi:hypothetical protein